MTKYNIGNKQGADLGIYEGATPDEALDARASMSKDVSREAFWQFILAHCPPHVTRSPRTERDGDYLYECYDDEQGREVAFASWHKGEATYTIRDTSAADEADHA